MVIEAVIQGFGLTSFILLYACFNITDKRYMEKTLLFFFGLVTALIIPFLLLAESLEVGSTIGYLVNFLSSYFVISILIIIAIVFLFALHIITQRLDAVAGEKDD